MVVFGGHFQFFLLLTSTLINRVVSMTKGLVFKVLVAAAICSSNNAIAQLATQFSGGASSGGASVSVPIAVPPGTAGLSPTLSFNYSSQGGGAMMGAGWSLNGMGAITRCPMNPGTDKRTLGVASDYHEAAFCLNGQRLIQVQQDASYYGSPIANSTQIQFRTEIESYSKIVAFRVPSGLGNAANGREIKPWNKIVGWRVWTKSGLIMEYGDPDGTDVSAASMHQARSQSNTEMTKATSWLLAKVFDTSMNYMEYSYSEDIPAHIETKRPMLVQYGGNLKLGTAHHSRVEFDWEAAPSYGVITAASLGVGSFGQKVKSSFFLSGVRTKTKAFNTESLVFAKYYKVNYAPVGAETVERSGYKRLVQTIQECDSDLCASGSVIVPASFEYSNRQNYSGTADLEQVQVKFAADSAGSANLKRTFVASGLGNNDSLNYVDVNGDGLLDACWVLASLQVNCSLGLKTTDANGEFKGFSSSIITSNPGADLGYPSGYESPKFVGFLDVNGDAIVDACFSASYVTNVTIDTYIGSQTTSYTNALPIRCLQGQRNGVFNGLLKPLGGFDDNWISNLLSGTSTFTNLTWFGRSDMNGDGIADPCTRSGSSFTCYISNPLGGARFLVNFVATEALVANWVSPSLSFVDFNRDGLVDICYLNGDYNQFKCADLVDAGEQASPRYSFSPATQRYVTNGSTSGKPYTITSAFNGTNAAMGSWVDVNGDGQLDLCVHDTSLKLRRISCYLGNGVNLSHDSNRFFSVDTDATWVFPNGRFFIDVNGDGRTDFCGFKGDPGLSTMFDCVTFLSGIPQAGANETGVTVSTNRINLKMVYGSNANATGPLDSDNWGTAASETIRDIADIGGNGALYLCRRTSSSPSTKVVCTGMEPMRPNFVMTKATTLGRELKFNYEFLPLFSRFSTSGNAVISAATAFGSQVRSTSGPGNPFVYPTVAMTPQSLIVSSTEEKIAPFTEPRKTLFGFQNYAVDIANGRGSLGFEVSEVYSESRMAAESAGQSQYSKSTTIANLVWPAIGQPLQAYATSPSGALLKLSTSQAPTVANAGVVASTCGGIVKPANRPWPVSVRTSGSSESSYIPTFGSNNEFVSRVDTVIDINNYTECGDVKSIVVKNLKPDGTPTGFEKQTTSNYFPNTIDATNARSLNSSIVSRWFLGRLQNSSVTHLAPANLVPVAAAFPVRASTTNPPPPVAGQVLPWLPAVLGLILN
jgi:Salmonella virulence plasmid 65kDa B protein